MNALIQWVFVSEGFPVGEEQDHEVIVSVSPFGSSPYVTTAYYSENLGFFKGDALGRLDKSEVTAWARLPHPIRA